MGRKWFVAGLAACVWSLAMATGNDAQQPGQEQLHRLVAHLAKPERRDFSEDLLGLLWAPDGFEINVFARGLGNPRMLAVGRGDDTRQLSASRRFCSRRSNVSRGSAFALPRCSAATSPVTPSTC